MKALMPIKAHMFNLMSWSQIARSSQDLFGYKKLTLMAADFLLTYFNKCLIKEGDIPAHEIWLVMDIIYDDLCDQEAAKDKGYNNLVDKEICMCGSMLVSH